MTSFSEADVQRMGLFWTLRLTGPLPVAVSPRVLATFQRADMEVAAELASVMGFADPTPVLQRFRRGRHCYIGRSDEGQLVAYGWITFDEDVIGELGLRVRLLPGEAYIWDCATLPAYRGLYLYPALLAWMQRELQEAGFQRIWIGMDADNMPSQTGVARAGFQHVIDILQVRHAAARTFLADPAPGARPEDVLAAQYMLFGDRQMSRIVLPET
jgi:ribosomal protein S18 acetylase RimI-like enzyme